MKKLNFILLLIATISFSISYGQDIQESESIQKVEETYIRSTIYYPFTNASFDKVEMLRNEVEKLDFVIKVKTDFKEEKSAGQLIVVTEHKVYTDEEKHPEFDAKKLKELITEKGFTPGNIKVENTTFNR